MTGFLVKIAKEACIYVWNSNASQNLYGHMAIKIGEEYWSFGGDNRSKAIAKYSRTDFPGTKPGTKVSFFKKWGKFYSMMEDFRRRGNPSYSFFCDIASPKPPNKTLANPLYQLANSAIEKNDHNNCMDAVVKTLMEHTSDQKAKEELLACLQKAKSVEELSYLLKSKMSEFSDKPASNRILRPSTKDL